MALPHLISGLLLPLALVASVGVISVALDRFALPSDGFKLARPYAGYGDPIIRTGSNAYPRHAVDSDSYQVRIARPAWRIASQYYSLDEYVYSMAPPERVVAVSESAYQQRISNVYEQVERFRPAMAPDVEHVLRLGADLVLVSNSSRVEFSTLLRSAGIPVYRAYTMFNTLDQVAETIRLTGYLTGEDEAAARELARFRSAIKRAQSMKPAGSASPRILGFGGRYSYGTGTLFHDIVRTLGGINVGAEGGLKGYDAVSTEQIIRWNPEWIVSGADKGKTKEVLERIMAEPAIALTQAARNGRVLVFEHHVFLPMSPYTTLLVTAIAEAIYGNENGPGA
jgi:iron complex transport system substrate-binding protein